MSFILNHPVATALTAILVLIAIGAGAFVGAVIHEGIHAAVAILIGRFERITWAGGRWFGGPCVEFRPKNRVESELIRKSPLLVGGATAAVVLPTLTYSIQSFFLASVVCVMLYSSREDLFASRAAAAAGE